MKKLFVVFAAYLLVVSCTDANGIWGGHGNSAAIGINVSDINAPVTKAGAAGEQLFDSFVIDTIGGREIKLDAYVSDINPDCFGAETKGKIKLGADLTEFKISAWKGAAVKYFEDRTVSKSSTTWSVADDPKWINDVELTFWSRCTGNYSSTDLTSPVPDASNDKKATISITNNGSEDLIYAYNKEKRTFNNAGDITGGSGTKDGDNYNDKMDIKFRHALAAVRFDISGLKSDNLTIKKVTFKGAVSKATCVITNGRNKADTADSLKFVWTPKTVTGTETNKGDFSVEFASTDFTETGLDGSTADALMPLTSSKFLFMIPQEVQNKNITVELVYDDASGSEIKKTATLDHDIPWEAGKYYTYKLSVKKGLSVTVDDDLEDNVKDNLSIKYEGDKSAYIRALIVAYWVDASGNFLSNCDYKTQGTLEGLATGDWSENSTDGFFYYNKEVESGDEIGPSLLKKYTAPTPPIDGAILRMVIAAQATEYDSSKTCYEAFNSNNTTK